MEAYGHFMEGMGCRSVEIRTMTYSFSPISRLCDLSESCLIWSKGHLKTLFLRHEKQFCSGDKGINQLSFCWGSLATF